MPIAHRAKMAAQFRPRGQTPTPRDIPAGTFFAPCAFAIPSYDAIKSEVFGPILRIYAFEADELMALVDKINASGYGLTLAFIRASRKPLRRFARAHVGNVYVNRNQIGAVVGDAAVWREKGFRFTGPKAGGPHYLSGLPPERTYTCQHCRSGRQCSIDREFRMKIARVSSWIALALLAVRRAEPRAGHHDKTARHLQAFFRRTRGRSVPDGLGASGAVALSGQDQNKIVELDGSAYSRRMRIHRRPACCNLSQRFTRRVPVALVALEKCRS